MAKKNRPQGAGESWFLEGASTPRPYTNQCPFELGPFETAYRVAASPTALVSWP